mgnify:CR=1 FL=1
MRRIWRILDELEDLLRPSRHGWLTVVDADVDPAVIPELEREIAACREDLHTLVELLHLRPEHRSTRSAFAALAATVWADAEDLHPKKLRRYGAVDPATALVLAPSLERLARALLRLASMAQEPASPDGRRGDEGDG